MIVFMMTFLSMLVSMVTIMVMLIIVVHTKGLLHGKLDQVPKEIGETAC